MLIDHPDIRSILIGYQFHFGVGTHDNVKILDCINGQKCAFYEISKGCYRTSTDKISPCRHQHDRQRESDFDIVDDFIYTYKRNVDRRIRTLYREIKDTLIVKLDDIPVSRLIVDTNIIKCQDSDTIITGLITIQNIGICTISLWFENYTPTSKNEWRNISDPAVISFTISHAHLSRTNWTLSEFVKYLASKCHKTVNPQLQLPLNVEYSEIIKDWRCFANYWEREYCKEKIQPISYDIYSYPLAFIHYDLTIAKLDELFSTPNSIADLRLYLNGDAHWEYKSDRVIRDTVESIDISTRNSIRWLAALEGTLKIGSNELLNETSIAESFTVMLLEIDIILTMRYFLTATMNNLSELSKEMDNPIMVSKMKDQIFTTIDKYFNVNLSHNDQTLRRIEKFKKIFRVDDIYKNVTDRLEILSIKISNENSAIMEKQQVVLTIIYGLFGSMSVIYTFLQRLFKYSQIDDWLIFGCSFFMAALIGIIIYFITKILKIKRKNR